MKKSFNKAMNHERRCYRFAKGQQVSKIYRIRQTRNGHFAAAINRRGYLGRVLTL